MSSKTKDFIELASQAAIEAGLQVQFVPFTVGEGAQITHIKEVRDRRPDLDRFLIELTSMADRKGLSLQLALPYNDMRMKHEFRRYGFEIIEDSHHLQMERAHQPGIIQQEMDLEPVQETLKDYIWMVEARLPRGLKVYRMPKGTRVFHGTGATFEPEDLSCPCWVSTSFEVANHFKTWHDHYEEDDPDTEHKGIRITEYLTTKALKLLHIDGDRDTFFELEDRYGLDLRDPQEMAAGVCRLGFDGWIIPNNYHEGDDIVLCNNSVLKYIRVHRNN